MEGNNNNNDDDDDGEEEKSFILFIIIIHIHKIVLPVVAGVKQKYFFCVLCYACGFFFHLHTFQLDGCKFCMVKKNCWKKSILMNTFRSSITIFYELDRTQWSYGHRMQIRTFEMSLDLLVRRMRVIRT